MFFFNLLLQLVILVVAMVIAGLVMRWILAHPTQYKAAIRKTRRLLMAPFIYFRSARSYINCKRVGMGFSFSECLSLEWNGYDKRNNPEKPYYRI